MVPAQKGEIIMDHDINPMFQPWTEQAPGGMTTGEIFAWLLLLALCIIYTAFCAFRFISGLYNDIRWPMKERRIRKEELNLEWWNREETDGDVLTVKALENMVKYNMGIDVAEEEE